MIFEDCVLDLERTGIQPIADDEIFVKVKQSVNYWISNYGRLVNNLYGRFNMMKYDPNKNVHFTINLYDGDVKYAQDTYTDRLVAGAFLEKVKGRDFPYHLDKNKGNCYYKNLIYVTSSEGISLTRGTLGATDIQPVQQYVPYITNKKNKAYKIWNAMYKRCYDNEVKKQFPHYQDATMYEGWEKDPELFCEWYESNYYDVFGENMQVDKDLLFPGNKEYSPDKCCLLPQTLNVMLSNCKKHYTANKLKSRTSRVEQLPLGVRYDAFREKYYAMLKLDSKLGNEIVILNYRNTPEEAFEDYKKHKQACILIMADKYKEFIPQKVYDALLRVDVNPY